MRTDASAAHTAKETKRQHLLIAGSGIAVGSSVSPFTQIEWNLGGIA